MSAAPSRVPPLPAVLIEPLVRAALVEDLGRAGDITTDAIVPPNLAAEGVFAARQPGVVAGLDLALAAFRLIDSTLKVEVARPDGSRVGPGDTIAVLRGPARCVLTAERTALNFLCRLSGIASATASVVEAVRGHRARITCTRKSGRITPATVPEVAATGVDLISIGWLTHSAATLDIGLDIRA
jgi:nicotinate-nucleotide pyrophosphorylase (carboxylating)